MTDHQSEVDRLMAEYRRSREQLASVHRALAMLSVSESSRDGAITVTVGANGVPTGIDLHEETYRHYRPQRLAETIVRLTTAAAARAAEQAARILEPVLPPGTDPKALLAGTADLRPEEITPVVAARREPAGGDADEDPAPHTWMQQAHGGNRR